MFVFQEKDILAETSCRLAFLPPWGFYTHAGFLTCCTTVGEGAIFILLQINVLLLQVIIFVSDFFKTSCDGKLIQTQTEIKPFYFPFRFLKKQNTKPKERKDKACRSNREISFLGHSQYFTGSGPEQPDPHSSEPCSKQKDREDFQSFPAPTAL